MMSDGIKGLTSQQNKTNHKNSDTTMKKELLTIAGAWMLMFALSTNVHAQMKVGAGLAFGTDAEALGLTGNFYTAFPSVENLSVGGDIIYFLSKEVSPFLDRKWFELNLNGQYEFYAEQMINAYALGGLNIARQKFEYSGLGSSPYFDDSKTKVGLNLGVGGEYAFNESLLAFAEFKFVLSDFDQAVFSAGVRLPIGGK
jgi:opacity protein-like surface antigen